MQWAGHNKHFSTISQIQEWKDKLSFGQYLVICCIYSLETLTNALNQVAALQNCSALFLLSKV